MAGSIFGSVFCVSTWGESHGAALGAVVDGCPAGLEISEEYIQKALDRRKPGSGVAGTTRAEADKVEILSGVLRGVTEGTPIAMIIRNTAQRSADYGNLRDTFRPGHADLTYFLKYGMRDESGGGRSSGRETAARVAAGAVAMKLLGEWGVRITAYTAEAAGVASVKRDMDAIEQNEMRACDAQAAALMAEEVRKARADGDSVGGVVECVVTGCPAGWGECVADKLDAEIAKAMLSIGAIKGVEFGAGFAAARMRASEMNDAMRTADGGKCIRFESNNAGGILGGISRGDDIVFRVAVKPVPSIHAAQRTVAAVLNGGEVTYTDSDLVIEGRHDVCLCPRIVPVVEAMTALVLADMGLRNRASRISGWE